jgi:hypothetical protein
MQSKVEPFRRELEFVTQMSLYESIKRFILLNGLTLAGSQDDGEQLFRFAQL